MPSAFALERGVAIEDRRHRAVSGPVEFVVGSIGDDRGKQVVPLGLVAVPAWLESLRLRTLERDHDRVSAVEADKTLCSMGMVAEVRPAAGLLSAGRSRGGRSAACAHRACGRGDYTECGRGG